MSRGDYPDFSAVRAKVGGLKGVITELGDAPDHEHKWKSFPKCPFCGKKGCAGVFAKGGAEFFKCQHSDCSTGGTVMTEVGYIAAREGLSDSKPAGGGPSEAYKRLLEMAGLWVEKTPNAERGTANRERGTEKTPSAERGTANARPEGKKLSRPVTGAAGVLLPSTAGGEPPVSSPSIAMPEVSAAGKPADVDPEESSSAVACPSGLPHARPGEGEASLAMADGRRQMADGGKAKTWDEGEDRDWAARGEAEPVGPRVLKSFEESPHEFTIRGDEVAAAMGLTGGGQVVPFPGAKVTTEGIVPRGTTSSAAGWRVGSGAEEEEAGPEVAAGGDLAREALRWFYEQLEFAEADSEALDAKRGLEPQTCRVMGYRSNPRTNLRFLLAAAQKFPVGALVEAGLWSRPGAEDWLQTEHEVTDLDGQDLGGARPSEFYYGKGLAGEKWDPVRREKVGVYDFNHPLLIPYFNQLPMGDGPEATHGQAIVTEGEFKAGALWQGFARHPEMVPTPSADRLIGLRPHKLGGVGVAQAAYLTPPGNPVVGIGAVPGIWSWKRTAEAGGWAVQHVLRQWLKRTGVRQLMVAYDHEDKSHKEEWLRHDSVIAALLMGRDIADELGVSVGFTQLPAGWRDFLGGKADWDGVLAGMRALDGPAAWDRALRAANDERRTAGAKARERGAKAEEGPAKEGERGGKARGVISHQSSVASGEETFADGTPVREMEG